MAASSSTSSELDIETPPHAPATKSITRGRKRQCAKRQDSASNATRERNRRAAMRCRDRKKKHVRELEEILSKLDARRSSMQAVCYKLKEQVGSIKDLLMAHAHCNHYEIDEWIRHEARRFVENDFLP